MREINQFNKNVIETFASRQAYQVIKGHYIPIVMNNITDESVMDVEKRRYYIQSYEFTMLGFLIDEDEFEVMPAVNRVLTVTEFEKGTSKKNKKINTNPSSMFEEILFLSGVTSVSQLFDYTCNILLGQTVNVDTCDVYINDEFFGTDVSEILINTGDVLRVEIVKDDNSQSATIPINILLV